MKTLLNKNCEGCNRKFVTFSVRKIWCSPYCRIKSMKFKSECKQCKQGFQKNTGKQLFCSTKCRNEYNNEKAFRIPLKLTDEQRNQVKELLDSFKEASA